MNPSPVAFPTYEELVLLNLEQLEEMKAVLPSDEIVSELPKHDRMRLLWVRVSNAISTKKQQKLHEDHLHRMSVMCRTKSGYPTRMTEEAIRRWCSREVGPQ